MVLLKSHGTRFIRRNRSWTGAAYLQLQPPLKLLTPGAKFSQTLLCMNPAFAELLALFELQKLSYLFRIEIKGPHATFKDNPARRVYDVDPFGPGSEGVACGIIDGVYQ